MDRKPVPRKHKRERRKHPFVVGRDMPYLLPSNEELIPAKFTPDERANHMAAARLQIQILSGEISKEEAQPELKRLEIERRELLDTWMRNYRRWKRKGDLIRIARAHRHQA